MNKTAYHVLLDHTLSDLRYIRSLNLQPAARIADRTIIRIERTLGIKEKGRHKP
jgi:hypothetical protein